MHMRPILYVHGLEYTCVWHLVLIEALRNSASEAIVNTKRLRQRPSHFPQLIHTLYPRALKHTRQCAALSRVQLQTYARQRRGMGKHTKNCVAESVRERE